MPDPTLIAAVATIPPGTWAVGVSGGADSVALLRLVHNRDDLALHVVHLDHQTRGAESSADAGFVEVLAGSLDLPCTIETRSDIEAQITDLPANASSRYRAARLALFRRVIAERRAAGVLLAHHADDHVETILQRLLRGSGPAGIAGMQVHSQLGDLLVLRPLLGVSRSTLRAYLDEIGQTWREDASNASDEYLRNRLRPVLARDRKISDDLRELGEACRSLRHWTRHTAPDLAASFHAFELADLPSVLAIESARRWLISRGVAAGQIAPPVIRRLIRMASDAASPARQQFPGRVSVRRKNGTISAGDTPT